MSFHDKIMNIPPADGSVSFILGFNSGKTLAAKLAADADARIAALEAENAKLRKDADRYRFIKTGADVIFHQYARWHVPGYSRHEVESCQPSAGELDAACDAAIDAARSVLSQKEQGNG